MRTQKPCAGAWILHRFSRSFSVVVVVVVVVVEWHSPSVVVVSGKGYYACLDAMWSQASIHSVPSCRTHHQDVEVVLRHGLQDLINQKLNKKTSDETLGSSNINRDIPDNFLTVWWVIEVGMMVVGGQETKSELSRATRYWYRATFPRLIYTKTDRLSRLIYTVSIRVNIYTWYPSGWAHRFHADTGPHGYNADHTWVSQGTPSNMVTIFSLSLVCSVRPEDAASLQWVSFLTLLVLLRPWYLFTFSRILHRRMGWKLRA